MSFNPAPTISYLQIGLSDFLLVNVAEMNLYDFRGQALKDRGFELLSARVVPPGSEGIQYLGEKAARLHSRVEWGQAVLGQTELREQDRRRSCLKLLRF